MKPNLTYSKAIDTAIKLRDENKLNEAIKMYSIAIELKANDFLGQLYRGDVWCELQEYSNALIDFKNAAKENKISHLPYSRIGNLYYEQGKYEEAIKSLDQSIKKNKNNPEAWNVKGMCSFQQKKYSKCIEEYSQAIEQNNESHSIKNKSVYLSNRAEAFNKLKNYKEATTDLNLAIKLDKNNAFAKEIKLLLP